MSMFFINSAHEEDVDSPSASANNGQRNENSQESNNRPNDTQQYTDLTLETFWPKVYEEIRRIDTLDVRNQALPLARIKKIMKLDEDVKMISAEAPVLFAKAAELFIMELTLRAWVHTEDNKRRTLQRSDIAMAITKFDQFDFLIDIVPREEAKGAICRTSVEEVKPPASNEQIQYYFQLGNQQGNLVQGSTSQAGSSGTIQVIQQSTGQIQTLQLATQGEQGNNVNLTNGENSIVTGNPPGTTQIIQMQAAPGHTGNIITTPTSSGGIQLVQQVVTPNGDIQHIPIRIVTTGNR